MRLKVVTMALVLGMAITAMAQPVFAEQETGALVVTKLFRGIANAATGWMELFKQPIVTGQEQGAGIGLTWGLIKGIGYAVARSVAGGYEIATFPLPIPEGYKPIMQPEYVLSDTSQWSGGAQHQK